MFSCENMPIFVHVFEAFSDLGNVMRPNEGDADRLNAMLETLQQKGGRIIDVKVTMCRLPPTKVAPQKPGICRIYLILYEAEKRLL